MSTSNAGILLLDILIHRILQKHFFCWYPGSRVTSTGYLREKVRRVVYMDSHIPNASYPFIRLTLSHFRSFVRARCGFASADAHGIRARASSTCNCERHAPIPAYLLMILGGTGCHFEFKLPTRCSLGRRAISEIYLLAWPSLPLR